jgi:UDP-N-acetylmuramoyl-tripeptide--D-alanyl-D-alanine ligase
MKERTLQQLAETLSARKSGRADTVTVVSTDSRSIRKGDCFFAMPGPNFDGHSFVSQALAKGAVCAVVNRGIQLPDADEKYLLRVDDTVRALGALAADYRTRCHFKVIAITGSVGKTSTRHIVAHVLASRFRVYQAPKSFNNQIGLPLTLLAAQPDDDFVVAELGANRPGEIDYLTRIARPDLALVTNVCPAHLEGFGSLDSIIEEKLSIVNSLSPDGCLLLNGDYENLISAARRLGCKFDTFGLSPKSDIRPQYADWNHSTGRFSIASTTIYVPLAGRGNLENALAAWAVCSKLGFTAQQFAKALENLPPVPMRAELKRFGTVTVIDDSYNANLASMKNALDLLTKFSENQNRRGACRGDLSGVALAKTEAQRRRVFVCGDMAELGCESENFHRQLGRDIAAAGVELVLAVGPLAAVAASTARELADYDLEIETFANADSAGDNLHKFIKDYDIVLVKGSRTVALEKIVLKLRQLYEHRESGSPQLYAGG